MRPKAPQLNNGPSPAGEHRQSEGLTGAIHKNKNGNAKRQWRTGDGVAGTYTQPPLAQQVDDLEAKFHAHLRDLVRLGAGNAIYSKRGAASVVNARERRRVLVERYAAKLSKSFKTSSYAARAREIINRLAVDGHEQPGERTVINILKSLELEASKKL